MRRNTRSPVTMVLLLLAATTAAVSLMSVTAASASARTYVDHFAGGGTITLRVSKGQLRQVSARMPANCESNNGGPGWRDTLEATVSGALPLRSGRFSVHGEADNGVEGNLQGRLRNGVISGRLRLTFADIDQLSDPVDDSYVCDTGVRRFRAR